MKEKEVRFVIVGAGNLRSGKLDTSKAILENAKEPVMKVYLNHENEPEKSFCVTNNHQIINPIPFEKGFLSSFKVKNKNIRVGFILILVNGNQRFSLKTPVRRIEYFRTNNFSSKILNNL